MTVKMQEIAVDALEMLLEKQTEAQIEGADMQLCIRKLNDMMFAFAAVGINLGFTKVVNNASVITVADGAILGIKANLAIAISSYFSAEVPQLVAQQAAAGYAAMVNLSNKTAPVRYSSLLPRGSGNAAPGECAFYPDYADPISTEIGGSIALEDSTEASNE